MRRCTFPSAAEIHMRVKRSSPGRGVVACAGAADSMRVSKSGIGGLSVGTSTLLRVALRNLLFTALIHTERSARHNIRTSCLSPGFLLEGDLQGPLG